MNQSEVPRIGKEQAEEGGTRFSSTGMCLREEVQSVPQNEASRSAVQDGRVSLIQNAVGEHSKPQNSKSGCVCVMQVNRHAHMFLDTHNSLHTSDTANHGPGSSRGNRMGEGKEGETFPVYFKQQCLA